MKNRMRAAVGPLLALVLALSGPAVAQQPTEAQVNAIRQACRADYQAHCSSVPTGGSAALACLQQHAQSLSAPCQKAVSAASGGGAPAARSPAPAATAPPAEPVARAPPPPMSPRQEAALVRRACGRDFRAYCGGVRPGGGRIIECLEANGPSLSRECRSALMSARQGR